MARPVLSEATWRRLAPNPIDEHRLQVMLGSFTGGERRAFWAAVLLLDDATTIPAVVEGYALLTPIPPDARAEPEPTPTVIPPTGRPGTAVCRWRECGREFELSSRFGPIPSYCSTACRWAAASDTRTERRHRARAATVPVG